MTKLLLSGKFLYIDGVATGMAILESQLLVPEQHSDFCFSFWFYIQVRNGVQTSVRVAVRLSLTKKK